MAISVPEQGRLRHPISYFRTELYATPAYRSDTPWCIRAAKSPIPHLTANACGRDRKAAATATSAAGRRGRRRAMRLLRLQGAFARSLFRRAAAPCQPSRRSAKLPRELSVFERQPGTGRKSVTSVIAWRSATCRATDLGIDAEESANASIGGPRSSLCCVSFCAQRRLKSRQQRVSGGVP